MIGLQFRPRQEVTLRCERYDGHLLESEQSPVATSARSRSAANSNENASDDKAARGTTVVLARGQDLTVVFAGKTFKLKIQHDELGKPRVFGMGELMPMMFKRPEDFVLALSTRRFDKEFEFFGLPAEVRNMVYGFVYRASPNPPYTPWKASEEEDFRVRTKVFNNRRPLHPFRFLARMADRDCGISFVNRQALAETTPFLVRRKHWHVRGDAQVHALLGSMGPDALSTWTGPLTLHLRNWEFDSKFLRWSFLDLEPGERRSKIERINIVAKPHRLYHSDLFHRWGGYCRDYPLETPVARLLEAGKGKFGSGFKIHFDPPLCQEHLEDDVHAQLERAFRGEPWEGGYLETGGDLRLVGEVLEAIDKAHGNR
ncbi:hypothetical protein IWX49DRAFT_344311 [Phyllosticta citricarpa]|uniref:Uncharacterized protein n=1 Tax=Phyllosticta paracitricarpa TaxID=2016321 RepID=A0ABR1NAH3_9PEZI